MTNLRLTLSTKIKAKLITIKREFAKTSSDKSSLIPCGKFTMIKTMISKTIIQTIECFSINNTLKVNHYLL